MSAPLEVLQEVNDIAQSFDGYEYGLPLYNETVAENMLVPVIKYGEESYKLGFQDGKNFGERMISIDIIEEYHREWKHTSDGSPRHDTEDFIDWLKIKIISQ